MFSINKRLAENEDPSGGTTGRVKPYGRLGWMGARAEYSLDGEGLPLPHRFVAQGGGDVQSREQNILACSGQVLLTENDGSAVSIG